VSPKPNRNQETELDMVFLSIDLPESLCRKLEALGLDPAAVATRKASKIVGGAITLVTSAPSLANRALDGGLCAA
jgi:hypothetical protein